MKKNIIFFAILLLIPWVAKAEEHNFNCKNYGGNLLDHAENIAATSDGGYVLAGTTKSTTISGITLIKNNDALVVKYDKDGKIEWQKNFGGTKYDYFLDATETTSGIVVVGRSNSTDISGLTSNGGYEAIIVKYDTDGNLKWSKNYGTEKGEKFTKVVPTADGGVVAIGEATFNADAYGILVKYDKDGNIVWEKTTDNNVTHFDDIIITSDNSYVIIYHIGNNKTTSSAHTIKYNDKGEVIWDVEHTNLNYFITIKETENGYALIGNNTAGSIIYTIDETGKFVKTIEYKGQYSTDSNIFNSIGLTSNGDYIVAGAANSQGIVAKFDKNGALKWEQSFGGTAEEEFVDLVVTPTDEVIVIGHFKSTDISGLSNIGSTDIIITKYDKDGNKEIEQNYGGTAADSIIRIIPISNSKYAIMGYTMSDSIDGITTNGSRDIIVSELTFDYEITKEESENGTYYITEENGKIKISIEAAEGYELDTIVVKDSTGNTLEYTEKNGEYYFELIDDLTVSVTYKETPAEPLPEESTGEESKEEVTNPNTKVGAILSLLVIGIWAIVLGLKKIKGIKRFS